MLEQRRFVLWQIATSLLVGSLTILIFRFTASPLSFPARCLYYIHFNDLPETESRLAEFLLLLPIAVLLISTARVVVGISTFGTFTPALFALAFREVHTMIGIAVFLGIWLIGTKVRGWIDHFHLLQIPRSGLMLTLVIIILLAFILITHRIGYEASVFIPLFPLITLTGMIERFWTVSNEEGDRSANRTMLSTLAICIGISFILSLPGIISWMRSYPETLGIILAALIGLGRYNGFRLSELVKYGNMLQSIDSLHAKESLVH